MPSLCGSECGNAARENHILSKCSWMDACISCMRCSRALETAFQGSKLHSGDIRCGLHARVWYRYYCKTSYPNVEMVLRNVFFGRDLRFVWLFFSNSNIWSWVGVVSGNKLEISQIWGFYLCFCLSTKGYSWTNLGFLHWLLVLDIFLKPYGWHDMLGFPPFDASLIIVSMGKRCIIGRVSLFSLS